MDKRLVSIVIPAFNGEKFIEEAVRSVIGQTYKKLEIVVYDDGSEDKTADIVKSIKDDRIRYFHSVNEGLAKTLNKSIGVSHGEYICWFNQDDIFLPEKVEVQVKTFERDSSLGAVFCMKNDMNEKGELIDDLNPLSILNPSKVCVEGKENILLMLFQGCFLIAPTVMIKRCVFDDVGLFNEGFKIAFDFDMWFRIMKKYNIDIIDKVLYNFRHHKDNVSGTGEGKALSIVESCTVIINALEVFDVEDLFPEIKNECLSDMERNNAYSQAYLKWASFIFKNKWWSPHLLMPIYGLVFKALSGNPLLADAYKLAADICSDANLTDQKDYYNKRHNEQIGVFYELLDRLGWALKRRKQSESLELSNKIFSISPDHPAIYTKLYHVFKDMGRVEEAEYYRSFF